MSACMIHTEYSALCIDIDSVSHERKVIVSHTIVRYPSFIICIRFEYYRCLIFRNSTEMYRELAERIMVFTVSFRRVLNCVPFMFINRSTKSYVIFILRVLVILRFEHCSH